MKNESPKPKVPWNGRCSQPWVNEFRGCKSCWQVESYARPAVLDRQAAAA